MKRLFIAINLPQDTKEKIRDIVEELRNYEGIRKYESIRFLLPENWHLTITFLGYQPNEAIEPILKSIKETTKNYSNILKNIRIVFGKIVLAPQRTPRMIWLMGAEETSKILGEIKTKLENELVKNGVRFKRENRRYNTHLTLARFQFVNNNIKEIRLPNIEKLSFIAQSFDLMESHLKKTGAEYEIISSDYFSR